MKYQKKEMKAIYVPTNQVWLVMFGESRIDIDGEWSFRKKSDLKYTLGRLGLHIDRNNKISRR